MNSETMQHLGSVLVILSDLTPGDSCRALDEALAFYNRHNPEAQVGPTGMGYTTLVHKCSLDADFNPAFVPPLFSTPPASPQEAR